MKKFINLFLLFSFLAAPCFSARNKAIIDSIDEGVSKSGVDKSTGKIFYISPDGDDENAGTIKHPFVSLERAKLAIKNNKGN